MASTQAVRRSGRARNVVTSYADEQAQQQITASTLPAKRKKAVGKATKFEKTDETTENATIKTELTQDGEQKPLLDQAKQIKSQPDDEWTGVTAIKNELPEEDDFQPAPKKAKKRAKATKAIGKLDSEGVMRLDVTDKRPRGEKRPPRVYPVPEKKKASKGKSINLAAILAESFEERWERKVSKIKRLAPGEEEVRLKDHVPYMTESYNTFLKRATTQRMFVLSRTQGTEENCHTGDEDCPIHQVKIAGTTGNVYTVIISHMPTCSCPNTAFKRDNSGHALCKHVLYVLHFILKAPEHLCYQNAFLTSELKEITANAPALPTAIVDTEETNDGNRKPVEDDCPICCMEFGKDEKITWCKAACGNNIHEDCFNLWAQTKAKDNVTCPYCRSLWHTNKPVKLGEQSETVMDVQMAQRVGGYFNVRDQLAYD